MTEEEAKEVIIDDPNGDIVKRMEAHTCEGAIGLKAVSDPMFYDDGHAIFWAMMK